MWGLATGVAKAAAVHMARALSKRHPSRTGRRRGAQLRGQPAYFARHGLESVWIPPCASDLGAPLGSALWHYHQTLDDPLHVDGTARIQTVDRSTIPRFYGVIEVRRAHRSSRHLKHKLQFAGEILPTTTTTRRLLRLSKRCATSAKLSKRTILP